MKKQIELTPAQKELYFELYDLFQGVASDLGTDSERSDEFVYYARDWMCWENWDKKHSRDDIDAAFKSLTGKKR